MGGLIFDLMGRFKTVAIMFFLGGLCTVLVPLVSPNVSGFVFCRVLLQCSMVPIIMNPLINDYVKVRSRGQAMGMQ
jgi:MFS family permease